MTIRANAESWTGLGSEPPADFRAAQNPRQSGPQPLEPVHFASRAFTPMAAISFFPILILFGYLAMFGIAGLPNLMLIFGVILLGLAGIAGLQRMRWGYESVVLDADGLGIVGTLGSPVPWRHIGEVKLTRSLGWEHLLIRLDPEYEVHHLHPWAIRWFAGESFRAKLPALHISVPTLRVRAMEVQETVEKFRDNYCGE